MVIPYECSCDQVYVDQVTMPSPTSTFINIHVDEFGPVYIPTTTDAQSSTTVITLSIFFALSFSIVIVVLAFAIIFRVKKYCLHK